MLSDSEVQCPIFFLNIYLLSQLKIFKIFLDLVSDNSQAFYKLSV